MAGVRRHRYLMIVLMLLAAAAASAPCLPASGPRPDSSAVPDHRALRAAMAEPMPEASTAVLLFGRGGHLATQEYSIAAVRGPDGQWRGTAVGRSRIWVEGAPFTPMRRVAWNLTVAAGAELDRALARRCPAEPPGSTPPGPPPPGYVGERIDVLVAGRAPITFPADSGHGIAELIRPPKR